MIASSNQVKESKEEARITVLQKTLKKIKRTVPDRMYTKKNFMKREETMNT